MRQINALRNKIRLLWPFYRRTHQNNRFADHFCADKGQCPFWNDEYCFGGYGYKKCPVSAGHFFEVFYDLIFSFLLVKCFQRVRKNGFNGRLDLVWFFQDLDLDNVLNASLDCWIWFFSGCWIF
jgi:hypothetical protein